MNLTDEQIEIVEHEGDLSVSACAGSGKSSTILHYCKRRPNSPTLYLAYNKTVKMEAIHKFKRAGLNNVRVETMHSLAFSEMKTKRKMVLHENGQYKPMELVELLGLGRSSVQFGLMMATHILSFLNYYFNSMYRQLGQAREDYLETIRHADFRQFAESHFDSIVGHSGKFLKKMFEGEDKFPLTHDAYLKFYLMDNPQLPFDYIAVDEAQDSTMSLLDMLHRQKATRILVGDSAQAIYGFRHCVDAMTMMGFPSLSLSTSFRFGQDIANQGMEVLSQKSLFGLEGGDLKIIGAGGISQGSQIGVIARNNASLLAQAVMDFENGVTKSAKIGFEGGLKAYTFGGAGSLHDILWLYCKKPEKIRDPLIKQFGSFGDLVKFVEDVDDRQLKPLVGIVTVFGAGLFSQLSELKARQVEDRNAAEIMYTTCHRSKGLQYPNVQLLGFIDQWVIEDVLRTKEYPQRSKKEKKAGKESQGLDLDALNEELNCHYVALTRAENEVTVLPDPFEDVPEMVKINRDKYEQERVKGQSILADD